jgi:hypothetical protein
MPLTDINPNPFAANDIACIRATGVTSSTSSITYSPSDPITSEQMAAMVGRLWLAPSIIEWAQQRPTQRIWGARATPPHTRTGSINRFSRGTTGAHGNS